jgi:predicted dehydrogenase
MTPHARSLLDLSARAEVVGVYSRTEARRAAVGAQFGFPTTDRMGALIRDPRVGAVLIVTPPSAHLELVRMAAAAGKHILLEKPLERSLPRSIAVVETAREAGVTLGIVLQHRTRDNARRLAALVASGSLGELVTAAASIRWWRSQDYYDEPGRGTFARDGGGVLLTQAIHALDLFLSLTGPVEEVSATVATSRAHRMECEDVVSAAVRFANGAVGSIDATTASFPGFPERLEFVFDRATAVLTGENLMIYHRDGTVEDHAVPSQGHGGGADPMGFAHAQHRAILADFLDAMEERRPPLVGGAAALTVHIVIDAILASGAAGHPVELRPRRIAGAAF